MIHVGHLPGRVRPCIFEQDGAVIRPLAYFIDDEALQRFKAYNPHVDKRPHEFARRPAGSVGIPEKS